MVSDRWTEFKNADNLQSINVEQLLDQVRRFADSVPQVTVRQLKLNHQLSNSRPSLSEFEAKWAVAGNEI